MLGGVWIINLLIIIHICTKKQECCPVKACWKRQQKNIKLLTIFFLK